MSLINDALKRANQHQPPPQPASVRDSGAPMRPAEPRRLTDSGASPLIVGLIVLVLLLAGVLFYVAGRSSARSPTHVPIAIPSPAAAGQTATATQTVAFASIPSATNAASPSPAETSIAVPAPRLPETVVTSAPPASTIVTQVVVAATNVPAAAPIALKLQGISFLPSRPSAIINGRTVFVGDRIADARVLAITRSAVTVAQGGQTNVLSLE